MSSLSSSSGEASYQQEQLVDNPEDLGLCRLEKIGLGVGFGLLSLTASGAAVYSFYKEGAPAGAVGAFVAGTSAYALVKFVRES